MKKYLKTSLAICLAMIMTLSSAISIYAQTYQMSDGTDVKEFSTEDSVGIFASPRSALISSVTLELTQEGYRKVNVYSEILCHVEMEKIYMSITLQRKDGSSWKNVRTEDLEWLKEDYPNTALSAATASFNVGSLSAGSYRIRTAFSVYELNGSGHESRTSTSPTLTIN